MLNRKTHFLTIILVLLVTLVFVACTPAPVTAPATTTTTTAAPATTTASTANSAVSNKTTAAAAFPVTVKNGSGKDVVIDSAPQAIVVTNIWAAEILLDLVPATRIKGLSAWGDDPALSPSADKAKAVTARVQTTKPENIVALKPDLIVIDTFSDFDGSLSKTLTEAGSIVLLMNSPTDFTQIADAIGTLAVAVGEKEKGVTLIADMEKKLSEVKTRLAALKDDAKAGAMYIEDHLDNSGKSDGALSAYGPGSPMDAIIKAAGLINVCTAPNYSPVAKEKVVKEWKPDILIVPSIAYNPDFTTKDDGGASKIAGLKADPLMQTLPAVTSGKIIALTEKYRGSTSHYMADSVVELARLVYPDLFR